MSGQEKWPPEPDKPARKGYVVPPPPERGEPDNLPGTHEAPGAYPVPPPPPERREPPPPPEKPGK